MGSHRPARFLPFSCLAAYAGSSGRAARRCRAFGWCGRLFSGILKVCCLYKIFCLGAHSDAEAHISTESPPPRQDAWLQGPHEEQSWAGRIVAPSRQGPQARLCQRRLPRLTLVAAFVLFPPSKPQTFPGIPCSIPQPACGAAGIAAGS